MSTLVNARIEVDSFAELVLIQESLKRALTTIRVALHGTRFEHQRFSCSSNIHFGRVTKPGCMNASNDRTWSFNSFYALRSGRQTQYRMWPGAVHELALACIDCEFQLSRANVILIVRVPRLEATHRGLNSNRTSYTKSSPG